MFAVAFIALATAIFVNALYLQDAPRLAASAARQAQPPEAAEAPEIATKSATAALPAHSASPSAATPAAPENAGEDTASAASQNRRSAGQPGDPRLVQAIQRELYARGYAPGSNPGRLDLETRAAIIAYQFDEGMALTGEASEAVLKSLLFGRAAGKAGPGPDGRFERQRKLVAEVQDMLARMGYASGPVDGRIDERTREAIRRFEQDRSLAPRGRLTERLLLEMVIVSGRPLNASG